ncbi:alpha/beta-hydrolase [Aspergillus steynii IBT 23096]|uniref:Alpha/beta-hydrolase n=1 Tax=Aspergillus steynii IBT 23096 TaxID=1392250 RepID=A0A2I2FWV2_9EURO|nr:alpha/beta-hydrolase [Aspergillus steynii IBT 23096]PLB45104.1 alpha/beta-hydrolase [Aspergillus steynii IBT 23096]
MSHFKVIEHQARCQNIRERPGAVEPRHEHQLRLAVKQYIPKDNLNPKEGDVTLIGAHGNGFPKELYEPLWDGIYEKLRAANRRIRSIWIADMVHQGQSGVLNESILGDDPSWLDHGRDLFSLVNQYQDEMPHPIIGIGHSMGGMQLAHLSLMHPSLFQALVLVDPVIQTGNPSKTLALPTTYRRDWWPSRQEALQKFQSSSFYQAWDPRVLEKWVEYGLRDTPTELYPQASENGQQPVTLTTTKAQELFTFLRSAYVDKRSGLPRGTPQGEVHPSEIDDFPFYRPEPAHIFRHIPELNPSILYVFGENSPFSTPAARQEKIQATGTGLGGNGGVSQGRVKEAVLPCGHLVPMENVSGCAAASASFIEDELTNWEARMRKLRGAWKGVPRQERISIDDQWRAHIGELPRRQRL